MLGPPLARATPFPGDPEVHTTRTENAATVAWVGQAWATWLAQSHRCLAALVGEGKRTRQSRPHPQSPVSWCLLSSYSHSLSLGLSRQWAFHSGMSLLAQGQPLGRRPCQAPASSSHLR